MEKICLGVDIGGTSVKLGAVAPDGSVRFFREESVCFDGYRTPILDTVCTAVGALLRDCRAAGIEPAGIGVSATGQIDTAAGIVAGTGGNLPGWEGSRIRERLDAAFALPVTVANDANCMCLGEAWVGAARGCTDVIGITVGTGLGGGILTGGRLLEGASGLGGELGHLPIHALDGVRCTCGNAGCWERYASTTALVRRARQADPQLCDGRSIFAAAAAGRPEVCAVLDGWIDELAAGLIGLTHLFNPQRILIGGGVSAQQALLIEPLAQRVRAGVMPAFARDLTLCAAALGNQAGLIGGAAYLYRSGLI